MTDHRIQVCKRWLVTCGQCGFEAQGWSREHAIRTAQQHRRLVHEAAKADLPIEVERCHYAGGKADPVL